MGKVAAEKMVTKETEMPARDDEELHKMCVAALRRAEACREAIQSVVHGFDNAKKTLDARFIDSSGGTPLRDDPSLGVYVQRAHQRLESANKAVDDLLSQVGWASNRDEVERQLAVARADQARAQREVDDLRGV